MDEERDGIFISSVEKSQCLHKSNFNFKCEMHGGVSLKRVICSIPERSQMTQSEVINPKMYH